MGIIKRFCRDESGQFAIMFSVCSTLLIAGAMIAVDVAKLTNTKAKVSAVTDAAALAGAQAFDSPDRLQVVQSFLEANGSKMLPSKFASSPEIRFNDVDHEVSVMVDSRVDLPFAKMIGLGHQDVGYKSVAGYPGRLDPLTIAFALDISGSMGGSTSDGRVKLDALKSASMELFTIIENKVRSKASIDRYLRTGVSAFNSSLAVDQDMHWGFEETKNTIQQLNFGGATNTLSALENSYKQILDDRMFRISNDPSFRIETLDEFVIFMTDGENTAGDPVFLDDESYETCIAMREDGIEIFAIAFTAPARGQMLLLDCASWDETARDLRSGKNKNRGKGCKVLAGISQSLPNVIGLQKAYEKCKSDNGKDKANHYHEAADAESFEKIFRDIAQKINESAIRIKS